MAALKGLYMVLCVTGLLLSVYSVYIGREKTKDENYEALCDIDEKISCTSVLTSEYSFGLGITGKLFGEDHFLNVPTAYYGVLLYSLLFLMSFSNMKGILYLQLSMNAVSVIASVYLTYVLFFILHKTCLVCLGIHAINTGLLFSSLLQVFCTMRTSDESRKKRN